ncbi:hypothetical protein EYZ11_004206 [Aspergillus tanneri]|nr:hypothetical protein EYZ11_004206 [Aspergillus tanneri]
MEVHHPASPDSTVSPSLPSDATSIALTSDSGRHHHPTPQWKIRVGWSSDSIPSDAIAPCSRQEFALILICRQTMNAPSSTTTSMSSRTPCPVLAKPARIP